MNKTQIIRFRIAAAIVTLFLFALLGMGQTIESADQWSLMRIGDQPVGYLHDVTHSDSAGHIKTATAFVFVINRFNNKVEIKQDSEIEELADGSLFKVRSETSSSNQSTVLEAVVKNNALEIQTSTGGKSYTRSVPITERIVGPDGARRVSASGLKQTGDEVSYRMFVPEAASVVTIARKAVVREDISIEGQSVATIRVEEQIENYPVKRAIWLDGEGRIVKQTEPGPFGVVELVRSDRQTALNSAVTGGHLPDEMYARSIVRSNIRLPHPRSIEEIKIRITHRNPELGWPKLESEYQKVVAQDRTSTILVVRRPKLEKSEVISAAASDVQKPFLAPNAVLQSDDPQIQKIAQEAAGNERDSLTAARKLQQWAALNMHMDLGIAIAPASEVARNRGGTCVAYSVLLSSLERAKGIPSRVVMGFVYTNGMWGGHAWTEILVGNQWIPLDAAMYSPGIADAARFKFMSSTLEASMGSDVAGLQQIYGSVDITILEYTIGGKRVVVPEGARPYSAEADTYRNSWLGFSIRKPDGFSFADLDAVWPSLELLEMRGPKGEVVRLSQRGIDAGPGGLSAETYLKDLKIDGVRSKQEIAGRSGTVLAAPDKAALAFIDKTTVWVLSVEGNNASGILKRAAATWGTLKPVY